MLSEIHLPSTLKNIGNRAFSCMNISNQETVYVKLPESIESLGEDIFRGANIIAQFPDTKKNIINDDSANIVYNFRYEFYHVYDENDFCIGCHTFRDSSIQEKVLGYNLILDGRIGIKITLLSSDNVKAITVKTKVSSAANTNNAESMDYTLEKDKDNKSVITIYLAAKDLDCEITCYSSADKMISSITYAQLLQYYNSESSTLTDTERSIAVRLFNYSNACSNYFNSTSKTVSASSKDSVLNCLKSLSAPDQDEEVITLAGYSLLCADRLRFRCYFHDEFSDELSLAYKDEYYSAGNLNLTNSLGYSPLHYIKSVLTDSNSDEELITLCCALYDYYCALNSNTENE